MCRSAQSGPASRPVSPQTATSITPAGRRQSRGCVWAIACFMNAAQILAGNPPPVTFSMGESSSLPTHTAATSEGVNPMNQAFR